MSITGNAISWNHQLTPVEGPRLILRLVHGNRDPATRSGINSFRVHAHRFPLFPSRYAESCKRRARSNHRAPFAIISRTKKWTNLLSFSIGDRNRQRTNRLASLKGFVSRARSAVNPSWGRIDGNGQKAISARREPEADKKKGGRKKNDWLEKSSRTVSRLVECVEARLYFGVWPRIEAATPAAWKTTRVHENSQAVAPSKLAKALGG